MTQPSILVVESDNDERRRISGWLDEAGYAEVMFCPGPAGPDYTCIGGRGRPCPLSDAADVVVVDLHLRSDEVMQGTPGWQLMLFYYEHGKKVVAISGADDAVRPRPDDQVLVIDRPVERESFLRAVDSFA